MRLTFSNDYYKQKALNLNNVNYENSVTAADAFIVLLKDLSLEMKEMSTEEREKAIQNGVHYSEMLPIAYESEDGYVKKILANKNNKEQKN